MILPRVVALADEATGQSNRRVRSIDILKGAAIIGVVLAHLMFIQNAVYVETERDLLYTLDELPYAGLPMFLVLSGYFYKSNSIVYNLKKKVFPLIIALILAVVVLTVVMYCYLLLLGYDLSGSDLWGDIAQIIIGKGAFEDIHSSAFDGEMILDVYEVTLPFYFLQIMAVGYLIFYPIADFALKNFKRLICTILVLLTIVCVYMELVHIQLPFYAQLGPLVAVLYLVGAYMGKYKVADYLEHGHHEKRYWKIFGVIAIIAVISMFLIPTNKALIYSEFGDYGGYSVYTFMITSLSCGMVLFFLAALASHIHPICRILSLPGRESLPIFALHMFVAKMLVAPFVKLDTESWIPIKSLPITFMLSIFTVFFIAIMVMVFRKLVPRKIKQYIEEDAD